MSAPVINALSVDVEDYFHATALSEAIGRDEWDRVESRVRRNTDQLLEIFADRDVRATFFILGWIAERDPQLVKDIAAGGHEIASHGFSHELVYRQSRDVFRDETLRSKQILEDISGRSVTGYRAASFSITPASEWAVDILIEAGFDYDSSTYPISHDLYSNASAPRQPYWREGSNGGGLVELPLPTTDILGVRVPVGGGGYFRLYPYWFLRWCLNRVHARSGLPFVFYLHPWEIDDEQPRLAVSRLSRFRHYNNLHKSRDRLIRLLDDFRFDTCRSMIESLAIEQPAPVAFSAGS